MLKKFRLPLFGLIAYLTFLVLLIPAAQAVQWLPLPLEIRGVSGSLWQGRAVSVEWGAETSGVKDLAWRFAPFRLLLGRLGFDLQGNVYGGKATGQLALGLGGSIKIQDAQYTLDAAKLAEILILPLIEFEGRIQADIETLELADNALQDASGQIRWENARLKAPFATELGNYTADIVTEAEAQRITLTSTGGNLQIDGDIQLQGDRYNANLRLQPRPQAPAQLNEYLGLLARRQGNGVYALQVNGQLSELGL